MGDSSDLADVERFLRSGAGRQKMEELRLWLRGRWIQDVGFSADVEGIELTISFHDDATHLVFILPELSLAVLRDKFADVLEAEYQKAFPKRARRSGDEV